MAVIIPALPFPVPSNIAGYPCTEVILLVWPNGNAYAWYLGPTALPLMAGPGKTYPPVVPFMNSIEVRVNVINTACPVYRYTASTMSWATAGFGYLVFASIPFNMAIWGGLAEALFSSIALNSDGDVDYTGIIPNVGFVPNYGEVIPETQTEGPIFVSWKPKITII